MSCTGRKLIQGKNFEVAYCITQMFFFDGCAEKAAYLSYRAKLLRLDWYNLYTGGAL